MLESMEELKKKPLHRLIEERKDLDRDIASKEDQMDELVAEAEDIRLSLPHLKKILSQIEKAIISKEREACLMQEVEGSEIEEHQKELYTPLYRSIMFGEDKSTLHLFNSNYKTL